MPVYYALNWFFRLGPIALGALALAILGAGVYFEKLHHELNADRAMALQQGPPAAVDIARFDRDIHSNAVREVVVQAQPVFEAAYGLTLWGERRADDAFIYMVPLVSSSASDPTEIVGIAYFEAYSESFDTINEELMMRDAVGDGKVGPVINYNGKINGMGIWDELTEDAFYEMGLSMPENPVIVWPYMEGRDVALQPIETKGWTIIGLFSKAAGVIGLFALAKLAFFRKEEDAIEDMGAAPEQAVHDRAAVPVVNMNASVDPAFGASDVPLWKQRAGLANTPVAAPISDPFIQPTAPQAAAQSTPFITEKPRRSFGLRKALIGIVGGLFVIGLVSTVGDVISKSSSASMASVSTPQERVATTAADIMVSDADPNRHWTDIDVTPVIEWFVAKFLLAVTGDTDAQMTLGMIGGGVFFALVMLRYFFTIRSVLKPRAGVRFDDLLS